MKKKLLAGIFTVIFLGISLANVKSAYAFWPFDTFKNGSEQESQTGRNFPLIIQKMVDKFNLNPDEVEGVFNEARGEAQARKREGFEKKLETAVEDGKLTSEQRQAILDKKAEMQKNCSELEGLSFEERQELRKNHKEELETWAEDNSIDLKLFFGAKQMWSRRGHFGLGDRK